MKHAVRDPGVSGGDAVSRRRFVRNLVTTALWCAAGGSVAYGADETRPVQWLDRVDPPSPVPGMTYLRASEIGCALDCDLSTGRNISGDGTAATDDAPRINAALAGARAEQPMTLILDGTALISGLFLPAGGYWHIAGLGRGTGFFMATGANNDAIHNSDPKLVLLDPGPPAPARGRDVSLSNFTLNVNRGDGHTGDSTTGTPLGGSSWYMGINLQSLDNVRIENVVIVNSPTYHMRLSNVGHVTVKGCVCDSRGLHTDGVHFDGPANDLTIEDCQFALEDDAIALNCPEGYSGDIERVSISNCRFDSFSALRLYTLAERPGPAFHLRDVAVSGCTGKTTAEAFLLEKGVTSTPESIDRVTISGCEFASPALLNLAVSFGSVLVQQARWTPAGPPDSGYALAHTSLYDAAATYRGTSLTFRDCTIVRKTADAVSALVVTSGSRIAAVEFDGLKVEDAAGGDLPVSPALVTIVDGSVGQLGLDRVDGMQFAAPVSAGGFAKIGSVAGSGLVETGWEFPDGVVAPETPYVSASTGQPSIKRESDPGVVQPYR